MRRAVTAVAAAGLLIGPTVLAFFSGGYFDEPRLIAAMAAWALILALTVAGPAPLPRALPGRLALGGLAALTAWTAVSLAWAPLGGPAVAAVERLVLYTGTLLLAIGVLREPRAMRALEPALAAGATVVIGYGLADRLLPGIVELARSESARGRLEQPITYWNAEGALAAIGLVLCARIAGDRRRRPLERALAAAAAAPLGAGVYLSFSRGAIAVAVLGLVILVAAARSRAQLGAAVAALLTGAVAATFAAAFDGVSSLSGSLADREREGAIVLALLVLVAAAAALLTFRRIRTEPDTDALPWTRHLLPVAAVLVAGVAIGLVAGGLAEQPSASELAAGAQARRLTTASSNRYEYWRVGLAAFADRPLQGLGAAGFRVRWLQERPIPEAVRDVHSIELEQAAELGLPGLLAFAALLAGAFLAGRTALRRDPAAAAGAVAATLAWLLHASIDWDWQIPAVSLPAVILTGALVVIAER
jgi:O-Antigen ligase